VAIVGESGSGKTTSLRMIAGLEAADAGSLCLAAESCTVSAASGMVFQQPRHLPWLTVRRNVSLGHELRGLPRLVIDQRAGDFLDLVGLGKFAGLSRPIFGRHGAGDGHRPGAGDQSRNPPSRRTYRAAITSPRTVAG
jgi:ABC-type nitrate/sulfonate/bicarbonate transport system ATPase subunit